MRLVFYIVKRRWEAVMSVSTRYKGIIAYDGTAYAGFQVQPQPHVQTIQGEIEEALRTMTKGEKVRIHGAGRTDAGVHAKGQVVHFDYPGHLPAQAIQKGLNALTSDAIVFWDVSIVDTDFHSRFLARGKKYQYRVDTSDLADPLKRLYTYHHRHSMELDRVKEALTYFEGTHDFTSFTSIHSTVENKVRTIVEASVVANDNENEWIFTFRGSGFLYHMIRIMMGTLLEVGDGRREAKDISRILRARNREQAGITLHPKGLCMVEVYYDEESLLKSSVNR